VREGRGNEQAERDERKEGARQDKAPQVHVCARPARGGGGDSAPRTLRAWPCARRVADASRPICRASARTQRKRAAARVKQEEIGATQAHRARKSSVCTMPCKRRGGRVRITQEVGPIHAHAMQAAGSQPPHYARGGAHTCTCQPTRARPPVGPSSARARSRTMSAPR
jgi:hypothetical protein